MANGLKRHMGADRDKGIAGNLTIDIMSNGSDVRFVFGHEILWFELPKDDALALGRAIIQAAGGMN